jgi:lysophospholipase L1-like esterase
MNSKVVAGLLLCLLAVDSAAFAWEAALPDDQNCGTNRTALPPFEMVNGDRVALLGSTVIEREQRYGYWEIALTIRWSDRNIAFRNLGWSGDTVWGDARAGFDTAREGYQRLLEQTRAVKPTVILICYGTNESFAGEAGLAAFQQQLNRLLDDLKPTRARLVLLAPPLFEKATWPAGNFEERQHALELYIGAIRETAGQRGLRFVSEFCQRHHPSAPLTDNGIHLTSYGYWKTAEPLLQELGVARPEKHGDPAAKTASRELFHQAEALRRAIVEKNRLYFHRWRPENETYLFGFRKYEQGQNAREIAEFDPLVEKQAKEIARLRQKIPPTYRFLPEEAQR